MQSAKLTRFIVCVYLLLLTWGILFKFETQLEYISFFVHDRNINWIPFSSPMVVNGDVAASEMVFNILCFMPYGVAVPLVKESWPDRKIILSGFLLSLCYEVLQFILAIGNADVTDLFMNTLGVMCGLGLLALMRKLFPTKVRQIVNLIGLNLGGLALIILAILFILGI
ncbi:VanZ family protein [Streptococcus caviae]|uniref:VanZ family protein n=1 Tax=Streptococcus sp. 'caviae' TaxID=1915004 RepID=UPI000A5A843C|nr:VanZ family protein [Streptococcus sp. 'caviae']